MQKLLGCAESDPVAPCGWWLARPAGHKTHLDMEAIAMPNQLKRPLGFKQCLHLKAAECWLALGEIEEARRELQKVARNHPDAARAYQEIQAHIESVRISLPE